MPSRPDLSGGFFKLALVSPDDTSFHTFHVEHFNPATLNYTAVDATKETSINDTVFDLASLLAPFFPTDTGIVLSSIWQTISGGTDVAEVLTGAGSFAGINGSGSATGVDKVSILTLTARDVLGWPWRVQLPRPVRALENYDAVGIRTAGNTTGDAQGIIADYLTRSTAFTPSGSTSGGFSRIVSHHGGALQGQIRFVSGLSKRLRRRFNAI